MDNKKKNLENLINEKVDGEKIKGGTGTIHNPGADGGSTDPMLDQELPHEHEPTHPHENEIDSNTDDFQDPMAPNPGALG